MKSFVNQRVITSFLAGASMLVAPLMQAADKPSEKPAKENAAKAAPPSLLSKSILDIAPSPAAGPAGKTEQKDAIKATQQKPKATLTDRLKEARELFENLGTSENPKRDMQRIREDLKAARADLTALDNSGRSVLQMKLELETLRMYAEQARVRERLSKIEKSLHPKP